MAEERWHDFAKEKPSEDMEGRNFIVSNGHLEKIATWCGYWENEPFIGDRLCDEVVRWKFYFTPEEEKANDETRTEPKAMKCDELEEYYYYEDRVVTPATHMYRVYHADKVDAAIAELKAENERLKKQSSCTFSDDSLRVRQLKRKIADNSEKILELQKALDVALSEVYSLLDKIESLKASHYAESVDAGMRERRLKRALWIARAERAKEKQQLFHFSLGYEKLCIDGFYDPYSGRRELSPKQWIKAFNKVEVKLLKKAEEYK